jgi:hypothetical protein
VSTEPAAGHFDFDLMKMSDEFSDAEFDHAASGKPLPIMKILAAQIVMHQACARLLLGLSVNESRL